MEDETDKDLSIADGIKAALGFQSKQVTFFTTWTQ
jgi:hypothetical protein